ncbi:RING finger protein 207 isoform X2 [Pipistrellus kuhlii]|uniref:RING finger protein 207 isoform X2 n=1 Tax=Pipistrellus kuhlii TaxID=59472 RepID=UPI001E271E1A|nr:RING finger protein 207 isoform X2 [Pipistrellus kuhlii]
MTCHALPRPRGTGGLWGGTALWRPQWAALELGPRGPTPARLRADGYSPAGSGGCELRVLSARWGLGPSRGASFKVAMSPPLLRPDWEAGAGADPTAGQVGGGTAREGRRRRVTRRRADSWGGVRGEVEAGGSGPVQPPDLPGHRGVRARPERGPRTDLRPPPAHPPRPAPRAPRPAPQPGPLRPPLTAAAPRGPAPPPADVGGHLRAPGGPGRPGRGGRTPARVPAVPRAVRAPVPAGLLPPRLRRLPAGPRRRRPPGLSAVPTPDGGEGPQRAPPGGPAAAVPRGQLRGRPGGGALCQLRPGVRPAGRGHHLLLQHVRAAAVCALPRGDAPRPHVREPRHRGPGPAQPRRAAEVRAARGALHHVLHRHQGAAVHPLLPGHAGGEPSALRGPGVGLRAGLRAAAAGGAGSEGTAGGHARGHRAAAGHAGGGAAQRGGGGGLHPLPVRQPAGQAGGEKGAAAAGCAEYEEKDKAFKVQLSQLATLLPTLQVHLVICSSFLSLASKAEFLDLGYELMERLQGIATRPHRLRPAQSSKIVSDHRAEFARCLEPLLLPPLGPRRAAGAGGPSTLAGVSGPKVLVPSCPSPVGKLLGSPVQKPTLHRAISTKVLLAEGEDTPFLEHCRRYEDSYRRLQAEMQSLKDQVQELHRDLTKHHALIKAEIMADILRKALQVDAQIASEYASAEGMRAAFQEMWAESYQRVANEQEIYEGPRQLLLGHHPVCPGANPRPVGQEGSYPLTRHKNPHALPLALGLASQLLTGPHTMHLGPRSTQLYDLLQLKQENAYLTTITKQITPYIRSIAKVKERLEPRFQAPADEESEQLQDPGDASTSDEAQARSDPVCGADKREKTSEPRGNGRTPHGLTEEPPLQNKDPHRPKARTGGDAAPRRERPA